VFTIPITISLPVGGARLGNAADGLPAATVVGAAVSAVLFVVEAAGADVVAGAVVGVEVDELLLHAAARSARDTSPAPHA
jgi:hypothetical protein